MFTQEDEQNLLNFFGGRDKIDRTYKSYHPMRFLLVSIDNKRVFNTKRAFKTVYNKDKHWLDSKKRFLESENDIESSSAFGELRTYGNLLLMNFQVVPAGSNEGADFKIADNSQNEVFIETLTKNLAQNSSITFGTTTNNTANIKIEMTEIAPYGLPACNKKNDGISTNMISKICAIKQDEQQLSDTVPSIIWVDLQDNSHCFSEKSHCLPILSKDEYLTSGCLWHALYGHKGDRIYEDSAEFDRHIFSMEHNGRFIQSEKVSGFIFSFEDATVLMENPWSKNKLPLWFKKNVLSLWLFSLEYSLIDFGNNTLIDYIECQRKYLNAIHNIFQNTQLD
jgi:hypothetical protein